MLKWITAYRITPDGTQRVTYPCAAWDDSEHVWLHAQAVMGEEYGHLHVTGWTIGEEEKP